MGRVKNSTNTYIFEGETESAIIAALSLLGRKVKFNILQRKIKTKLTTFRPGNIFLVIDMDDISQSIAQDRAKIASCLERLEENISALTRDKNCHNLFLVLQYYNLEDELEKACSLSRKAIFKHLGAVNNNELKTKIINSQNLLGTLTGLGFNRDRFWCSSVCEEHESMVNKFLKNKKVKVLSLKEIIDSRF